MHPCTKPPQQKRNQPTSNTMHFSPEPFVLAPVSFVTKSIAPNLHTGRRQVFGEEMQLREAGGGDGEVPGRRRVGQM